MAHKGIFHPDGRAAKLFAALLALVLWQLAAMGIDNRLLLVGPLAVVRRLLELLPTKDFWAALGFSFTRIAGGFLLGFLTAAVLAAVSGRFPLAATLLRPYLLVVQAVPVASFIVLALMWLSGKRLSIFIAFLMVLPVLYRSFYQGILAADPKLLELAQVYRMPRVQRLRCVYLPALRPYVKSASHAALGLCWKAGVAAEVIAVTEKSVGGMLYEAKVYLEIADLFAWTLVIVAVSGCFEQAVVRLLDRLFDALED